MLQTDPGGDSPDLERQFERVVDALTLRFDGLHEPTTVARVVQDARRELERQARITTYLPVLATKRAVDRLTGV
ncbi:hypothetical protein GCM10022204_03020 [Microlunatus aurantiacus]|uniref:Protein-tyrosine-phosphatase-like N-terminal domain-containing protein n=1 Tax=Microlunatus aurantiacus TaxID=446786 RepID=A0ABP7CMI6_9ACTN